MTRISSISLTKIVINIGITAENRINSSYNAVSGLRQTVDKTFEKYLSLLPPYRSPPFIFSILLLSYCILFVSYLSSSPSIQSAETRVETPFSCIVMPVQTVCRRHRTAPVGDDDELEYFCQLMQILCKTRYVGIVERRLDLVK